MKGICFIEPMFMATIECCKNQTRRFLHKNPDSIKLKFVDLNQSIENKLAKYKIGEVVYLKEPYTIFYNPEGVSNKLYDKNEIFISYKFDKSNQNADLLNLNWKNKLFMPAKYARYFIKITNVRIEKLGNISEQDCINEGIISGKYDNETEILYPNYLIKTFPLYFDNPKDSYITLWNYINGLAAWERDKDKFVFVYDYELKKDILTPLLTM